MKRNLAHWTQHYLGLGFEPIEAKQRAEQKLIYLQECDESKPSENKTDTIVYSK